MTETISSIFAQEHLKMSDRSSYKCKPPARLMSTVSTELNGRESVIMINFASPSSSLLAGNISSALITLDEAVSTTKSMELLAFGFTVNLNGEFVSIISTPEQTLRIISCGKRRVRVITQRKLIIFPPLNIANNNKSLSHFPPLPLSHSPSRIVGCIRLGEGENIEKHFALQIYVPTTTCYQHRDE
jgi:hypothetical protein